MREKLAEKQDLWEYLKDANKPIVIYGMGDGALKIIDKLKLYDLNVSAIFASDGFVRGHSFEGFEVCTFTDIKDRFDDFIILLAFAAYREPLLSELYNMSKNYEMYAPDVPVCTDDDTLFTLNYISEHEDDFDAVYNLLADDISKQTYLNVLNFKISGKISYLMEVQSPIDEMYTNLLNLTESENYVDLGAYNGDTIKEFLQYTNNRFSSITAIEPDAKNYRKLTKYIDSLNYENIATHNIAVSDSEKTVFFSNKSGRNSSINTSEGKQIKANSVDSLLYPNKVSVIKYDVEGEEISAIIGCEKTIKLHSPALLISAYHKNSDLFSIPLLISTYKNNYKIYLRHHPYIPAWETNFYFIP